MKFATGREFKTSAFFCVVTMILLGFVGLAIAAGGGDHGEAASKGWVITDTYKVMNFAVLAGVLFYLARKPVKEFFSSRTTGIREELETLEQKKVESEKILAGYAEQIATLDQEADRIVADYIAQGEAAKKRILVEAEAQAVKLEEMAKRNIEQEFKAARLALKQEIVEKALAKAEILVKESISKEDQDRLVDDYLAKVVA
ncbi:MAG: ATP synthase F0 subunit B [Desulfobacterium sp.]|nr:ATP synthase F0 subunit B [Desulfobacterium sp.]